MIAKKKMDDYNWPDLYRQADEFMCQNIWRRGRNPQIK